MGLLGGLFEDEILLLIILIVVLVLLLDDGKGCGGGIFDKLNLGDNWLLILILILCLCGDGFNIF